MVDGPKRRTGLDGVDVAILAGGLATRVRAVLGDVPKVLAPVGDRPFLDVLLAWLRGFGARRVVLCLGHLADRVIAHVDSHPSEGMEVLFEVEPRPLGTAGALRRARTRLVSPDVLVINGDTFVDADLSAFVAGHRTDGAAVSLLCAEVPSMVRFGGVERDSRGRVARFVEKDARADRPGLISAGIYLFSQAALDELTRGEGESLERDFLQASPPGTIRAEVARGRFIDIGTPESLAEAERIILQS